MSTLHAPQTLQDALDYAAQHGVQLSPGDYRRLAEIEAAASARPQEAQGRLQQFVTAFNTHYPAFLRFLVGLAEILVTTSQTVIVAFGAPIVLVLLLIVEHSRVKYGIALFEVEKALASFASWSLVILNTVLEFTIHHIEHKYGYEADRQYRGSLRLLWRSAGYRLGWGAAWQPQELSPAARYQRLQRLVTFTILALATAGSMREVIAQQPGRWHEALVNIVTDSSLAQMTTWLGGLLFAVAAVVAAQVVTSYLAIRSREILDAMNAPQVAAASPGEQAAMQYVLAKVAAKTGMADQRIDAAAAVEEAEHFLAQPPAMGAAWQPSSNGNGKGRH